MTSAATLDKLDSLVGANDLTVAEIRFVLKYWEAAPRKLHTNVINSVKVLEKIPSALQVDLISSDPRATRAIGELLCPEAQEYIVTSCPEDMTAVLKKVVSLKEISGVLWKHLAKLALAKVVKARTAKQLVVRKDCPPSFAKAVGYTKDSLEKERIKASVKKHVVRPGTVKSTREESGDDFTNVRRVAQAARTVKRPRS